MILAFATDAQATFLVESISIGVIKMSCKIVISFVLGVILFSVIGSEVRAQQASAATNTPKHVHPTHGPHGGELLEIGKEEFHAELIMNETKKQMVIYLLEKDAKSATKWY